jgi:hypothetical protein
MHGARMWSSYASALAAQRFANRRRWRVLTAAPETRVRHSMHFALEQAAPVRSHRPAAGRSRPPYCHQGPPRECEKFHSHGSRGLALTAFRARGTPGPVMGAGGEDR